MKELEQAKATLAELENQKHELVDRVRDQHCLSDYYIEYNIISDVLHYQKRLIYALERCDTDDADLLADVKSQLRGIENFAYYFIDDLNEDIQKAKKALRIAKEMKAICRKFLE